VLLATYPLDGINNVFDADSDIYTKCRGSLLDGYTLFESLKVFNVFRETFSRLRPLHCILLVRRISTDNTGKPYWLNGQCSIQFGPRIRQLGWHGTALLPMESTSHLKQDDGRCGIQTRTYEIPDGNGEIGD
jgi:hypothetical protein